MTDTSIALIKGTLDVLVLKTLSWGPLHGYAISKSIRTVTDETFTIEEGALYPALRRLEKKGLLKASWGRTDTGRDAKFYELTGEGRRSLDSELEYWSRYVRAMAKVLESTQPVL